MNNQLVTYFFFVAAVILYLIFLWQERRKIFMYRFYELRDELYRLAIEGKIDENSIAFKQLTQMLNITIAYSKKFKLVNFIKVLEDKKLDEPDKNKEFFDDLENQIIEVKNIAEGFFKNFFHLLIRNHPPLFIMLHIKFILNFIPTIQKQVATALAYKNSSEKIRIATS